MVKYSGVMTEVDRRKALAFLDGATDSSDDPPFALFAWFPSPHLPADHHRRYADLYRDEPLPKPSSFDETDVSDKPRWVRKLSRISDDEEKKLRTWHRSQLRSLRAVDDGIAHMLDLLEARGELENTYVVFTSDNGTHMGEHRRYTPNGAKNTAYEEAASVPFVVRGPGVPEGIVRDELVANNDLAPTFAEIAGAEIPPFVDGRSLQPVLSAGEPASWRTALLNERLENPRPGAPIPRYRAVITEGGYKYVEYVTGEKELYNLRADPLELRSIHRTADPALAAELRSRLWALQECAAAACRSAEGP